MEVFALQAMTFVAVALAVVLASGLLGDSRGNDRQRASRRVRDLALAEAETVARGGRLPSVFASLGNWLSPKNSSLLAGLGSRLALAGHRDPAAVSTFLLLQLATVLTGAGIVGGGAAAWGVKWDTALLLAGAGAAAGMIAPRLLLGMKVGKRQRALRNALPDALDIMVLSVEGGVSLNAALAWAAEELREVHPVLGVELATVHQEVQLGLSVGEAFRAFADRCGIAEARDLAAAVLQSERYGASVGKALRGYADSARQDRQAWAEEVAQKASVKIIFPMLLCIFPAIFIVLLGPAAMQMSRLFAR